MKKVIKLMQDKLDWQDYGGKHFESAYTSIFQIKIIIKVLLIIFYIYQL